MTQISCPCCKTCRIEGASLACICGGPFTGYAIITTRGEPAEEMIDEKQSIQKSAAGPDQGLGASDGKV